MTPAEKASFYEKLCSLGYAVYEGDHSQIFVQKSATFLDPETKEPRSFANRAEALESIKEEIQWQWNEVAKVEAPAEEIPQFEVYAEFLDGYGPNHADLGIVKARNEDELRTKARQIAEQYFAKTFPSKSLEDIAPRVKWRPYIKAE